ncbi:MAG TPA: J domain-containing protein [Candidatus Limnocylindria bacterium]|nr:J domain-containing protein [Candidatus Limnocylindria bacterium]
MPDQRFRGDPYAALDVRPDATDAQIKRRWRELAREHHPDRAAGDADAAAALTARMARINAAYDVLRDPARRAAYDSSPAGRRARAESTTAGFGGIFDEEGAYAGERGGPPPPPRTTPVTARYDTSAGLRPRNSRTGVPAAMRGHSPRSSRDASKQDLRASTPTGPVHRHAGRYAQPLPTLQEARETTLSFGRFHGYTLGEVELLEPSYIDWVARTITRDRDLVIRARLIQTDLDERGVGRPSRPATPGFGTTFDQ